MSGTILSQDVHVVGLIVEGGDMTSSLDSESIDMSAWDHCCMIFNHSASVTGNSVFTMNVGATDGTKTAAITFSYRYGGAAILSTSSDVYSAVATSASLTLTNTTYQGRILMVDFDAADMQSSGTVYRYATANFDGTASGGTVDGVAILTRGRYKDSIMATVVA